MFQFHYGSIKILEQFVKIINRFLFQFHYGSIKIRPLSNIKIL